MHRMAKMRLMLGMLHIAPWCYYPLTLQYTSSQYAQAAAGGPLGSQGHGSWHGRRGGPSNALGQQGLALTVRHTRLTVPALIH